MPRATNAKKKARSAGDGASPAELLALLDRPDSKEWLAGEIERAKARVAEAQAELKSLMTLEKIRAIRAGELRRKSPQRKKPQSNAKQSLADAVLQRLRDAPATSEMLSAALGVDDQRIVTELLRLQKAGKVRCRELAGRSVWGAV